MNKFMLIALLLGAIQLAYAQRLQQCNKNDVTTCKQEVGRILDRDLKVAHTTALYRLARRFVDVTRELIKRNQQDQEYVDYLRTIIRNVKNTVERIHENYNDNDELVKVVQHLRQLLNKDTLKGNKNQVNDETINRIVDELRVKETVTDTVRVAVNDMIYQLREINYELKNKDIKLDDVTRPIDELVQDITNNTNDEERTKQVRTTIRKLTETLDNLHYTKGVELGSGEYLEKYRKLFQN